MFFFGSLVVSSCVFVPGSTRAALATQTGRRAAIVARAGASFISAGELEDRILAMPPFQRATFGDSPAEIRRRFLEDVVLRDTLLLNAAHAEGLAEQASLRYALDGARSNGAIRAIRARVGPPSSIAKDAVKAYYDANRDRYDAPERIQIWRILCETRDEAQSVLDAAMKDGTPKAFTELARDHSQDKATRLRGGDLGFLTPEGRSKEPDVRVDPAIVRAAQAVANGELVPHPVPEGSFFAVVWRRGSTPALHRSIEEAAPQIREVLWDERVRSETHALIARLRDAKLRDLDEAPLEDAEL
jgi:peptidyl-prolyl cis-trans isomerase C